MSEAELASTEAAAAPAATSLTGAAEQPSGTGEGAAADAAGQGASSEQAGDAGATAEGEAPKAGEGEATQGAPEAYADFTTAEGYVLEGEMLEAVTSFAKAHNMSQEQAQSLVDLGAKQGAIIGGRYAELATQNPVMLPAHWAVEWSKQVEADKELGGEHLQQSVALAGRVFSTFGSPELGKFLNDTGLAHHPEIHRFMVKVGKAVSEDTLVAPQGGQQRQPPRTAETTAKKLYPNMK